MSTFCTHSRIGLHWQYASVDFERKVGVALMALAMHEKDEALVQLEPLLEVHLHHVRGEVGILLDSVIFREGCGSRGRHCDCVCWWCLLKVFVCCVAGCFGGKKCCR
jgi:hypothetical protein